MFKVMFDSNPIMVLTKEGIAKIGAKPETFKTREEAVNALVNLGVADGLIIRTEVEQWHV